jgi:hypothetical protein
MRKILLSFILLIVFCLMPISSVFAISVGVKPKELNLNIPIGRESKSEILVFNMGKELALYQVLPDAYNNKIFIEPADFRLEPNGNQIVKVIVKSWRPGKFATNISIVARPIGAGGIPVVSGVKVPIVITVSSAIFWLILAVILFFCFLGIHVIILKKRERNINNKIN